MSNMLRKLKQYGLRRFSQFALAELYDIAWKRPVLHSYSQSGEDLVLDKLLKHKKRGFYVDIGAYDPYRFSNTMRFYKRGWHGINIEPNTVLWKKFSKFRKRDINLNVGIGTKKGSMMLYSMEPATLSTFSKSQAQEYVKQGFTIVSHQKVSILPLSLVFQKYVGTRIIDFLSMDVEGYEMEVLRSNDWEKYRPKYLCIETALGKSSSAIGRFMKEKRYHKFFDNELNTIYKSMHE